MNYVPNENQITQSTYTRMHLQKLHQMSYMLCARLVFLRKYTKTTQINSIDFIYLCCVNLIRTKSNKFLCLVKENGISYLFRRFFYQKKWVKMFVQCLCSSSEFDLFNKNKYTQSQRQSLLHYIMTENLLFFFHKSDIAIKLEWIQWNLKRYRIISKWYWKRQLKHCENSNLDLNIMMLM